jgi:hypothetical protein
MEWFHLHRSYAPRHGHRRRLLSTFSTLALSTVLPGSPLSAQQRLPAVLTGTVTDSIGSPIVDVAVSVTPVTPQSTQRTTLTDRVGRYRFESLQPGAYELRTRRLGYLEVVRNISLDAAQTLIMDLRLATDPLRLEGVKVDARRDADRERARFESEPGVTARVVEATTLKLLPGLGEPDVLRAIELLPGVISTSDFSSTYNVRGGSADQNLIMIDGFTVFNPFHLGGLFSVFNSDAIERAELFSGGFGAEFGGRVSSVLNIESRTDIPESMELRGGVSMLASRLMLHAPMPTAVSRALRSDGGSWFLSARRSYFDHLLRPIANFPYHLTDLQAHAAVTMRGGGRIAATAYWGEDVLDLSSLGLSGGGAADVLRLRWNWGNRVLGATWSQPLGGGWIANSRLGYSRFADQLSFVDFGDVRFVGEIDQIVLRGDVSRDFAAGLGLRFGLAAEATDHHNRADAGGTTFFASDGDGILGSAHVSLRWRPSSRWIIEPGLRFDRWSASDTTRQLLSPRFAAKYFVGRGETIAIKLAVGRYAQFVHSLRDEELPVSNDTWVLANRWVPHVTSDQVQLGIESFWGEGWSVSAEGYARSFDGVTEFNTAEDPNDPGDDLLAGDGSSYGLDLLLRQTAGRLTGWAALSLLRAERTFPDPLTAGFADLPQTISYPPIFDRRINLDLVAQYTTRRDIEIGVRWNFGSGLPFSRPIAQHFAWRHNPALGLAEPLEIGPDREGLPVAVVLGPRNSERYPTYHRLDLTVRRTIERSWGSYVPYLQVLNVYNRRNVLFYYYDFNAAPPVRSGFSMFPLLPAIGVEVSF